jgi:hypothetical protein
VPKARICQSDKDDLFVETQLKVRTLAWRNEKYQLGPPSIGAEATKHAPNIPTNNAGFDLVRVAVALRKST